MHNLDSIYGKEYYEFDISKEYVGMKDSLLLGCQACVWREEIPTETKFEEHVYPSLQAFSEFVWTDKRDWNLFLKRMHIYERMMDYNRIRFYKHNY